MDDANASSPARPFLAIEEEGGEREAEETRPRTSPHLTWRLLLEQRNPDDSIFVPTESGMQCNLNRSCSSWTLPHPLYKIVKMKKEFQG
jgi:hypothetical protein